ncbi:MAG: glycosyltransferase involved in cell wall biosynthesis [Candidatus Azotimanducaceae bacterium]|jgi:glycosyltransferase involved in cell wall biosynthesis
MKRYLLLNYEYPPIGAGAANATYHMAREIVRLGHSCTVLTSSYNGLKGLSLEEGIEVHRVPAIRKSSSRSNLLEMMSYLLSAAVSLKRVLNQQPITGSIIFFGFPCGPLGLILKAIFKIPYVISLRGGDVPGTEPSLYWIYKLLAPIRRLVYRNSLSVVANSNGLAGLSTLSDPYPVDIIRNGVDVDFFYPRASRHDDILKILFVGRLHSQKNVDFLIQAFSEFQKLSPNARLSIVGQGPEQQNLENFVKENRLSGVEFLGWRSKEQLRELYCSADCLVNPSSYEGMPNVLLEAMACGLTVVASDSTGNNEVIDSGRTGLLFPLLDKDALVSIWKSLESDPKTGQDLSTNARQEMVTHYSWTTVATQYLEYFDD